MKPLLLCLWAAVSSNAFAQTFPAGPSLGRSYESGHPRKTASLARWYWWGTTARVIYNKSPTDAAPSSLSPKESMTLDTIFDCASLTKIVATTSALMKLFEQGKLRLNDRVTEYLPEFQGGKSEITIRNLMTHFSGLRPDLDLEPAWIRIRNRHSTARSSIPPCGAARSAFRL